MCAIHYGRGCAACAVPNRSIDFRSSDSQVRVCDLSMYQKCISEIGIHIDIPRYDIFIYQIPLSDIPSISIFRYEFFVISNHCDVIYFDKIRYMIFIPALCAATYEPMVVVSID
ncbi:hypothetical protein RvY_12558 [Ramazzottius varieornatus]|uniref:Uncharacterized protein n=1 Tax=Ramazzottius varieornatus TaxID=947166 RepID=A0A1D1VSI8_RAMVA|nr:hypothetical protein RvY_12558 [Ramazzottius varieornatus]